MNPLFHDAKLKIQRAVKHINDLNSILAEFSNRKTHEVVVDHDADGGDDVLHVVAGEMLPDSFSLTLGDALHNLRASLDYVIGEIEFSTTGARNKYTRFPVDETRDTLIDRIEGGLAKRIPKQVIDCIVEGIQPYKRGAGDFIFSLNEIDIEDKHRILIAKMEYKYVSGIVLVDEQGKEFRVPIWQIVNDKVSRHCVRGGKNCKVKNQGQASFDVLFGDGLPFAGYAIVPALRNLTKAVAGTVKEIEYWFRRSQI